MKCSSYITIANPAESKLVIKKSTFLSFTFPIQTIEEAEERVRELRKKFYDARHVCYAYVLEPDGSVFRSSDAGEPSGTAGRPIQGAILSASLTGIIVIVVRYFGGIKLGTPGLIAAYREAAEMAISSSPRLTIEVEDLLHITCPYSQINAVMQFIKRQNLKITSSQIDSLSIIIIKVGVNLTDSVLLSLNKLPGVKAEKEE